MSRHRTSLGSFFSIFFMIAFMILPSYLLKRIKKISQNYLFTLLRRASRHELISGQEAIICNSCIDLRGEIIIDEFQAEKIAQSS